MNFVFYEDDGIGDLTKIEDPEDICRVKRDWKLYQHDGYSLSKVDESEYINNDE